MTINQSNTAGGEAGGVRETIIETLEGTEFEYHFGMRSRDAATAADAILAALASSPPPPVPERAAVEVREAAEQVRYHWEVIQGQCSEGDGFTERAATELELAIVALEDALASPAPSAVTGEAVAWLATGLDGRQMTYQGDRVELPGYTQVPLYAAPPLPAAAVDVVRVKALTALYEWYDRDGSVGSASQVFEAHRAALTATQAGKE